MKQLMEFQDLKIGAQNLLGYYQRSRRSVAEAYIRGDIAQHLESFLYDVVSDQDIAEARERLDRSVWRLEERIMKLEEEVRILQKKTSPSTTMSPYEPRLLPKR